MCAYVQACANVYGVPGSQRHPPGAAVPATGTGNQNLMYDLKNQGVYPGLGARGVGLF